MGIMSALTLLAAGLAAGDLPANTWRELADSGITSRPGRALTYVPSLKQFVVTAGAIEKPDWSVQFLDLTRGTWESVPFTKGVSGAVPPFRYTNRLHGYYQYALDADAGRIVHYLMNGTILYDPVARRWATPNPAAHPLKGGPLWLWGALCYDPVNKEILCFGGANALTKRGDPGTWVYSVEKNEWRDLQPAVQPPQRALSPMVYDPKTKSIVLFGGDQLDALLADTWVYDCATRTWRQARPPVSPSPRCGHALLYLPKSGRVLLVGGATYTHTTGYMQPHHRQLPMAFWTYDVAAERWALVKRFDKKEPVVTHGFWPLTAAVNEADVVVALGRGGYWYVKTTGTWMCRVDPSARDAAGEAKVGVTPGTVLRRRAPYTVEYFTEGVPAADTEAVEQTLKSLPANTWTLRPTPRKPRQNRDWGTAVIDPDRDQIYRWSGGHCAHSGTEVPIYSITTDRWRITYPPEFPIEFCYSNGGTPGQWSFKQRPWMTGHTYHAYAYDPLLKKVVISGKGAHTYIFDPETGDFEPPTVPTPFRGGYYYSTLCSTPLGVVAWSLNQKGAGSGLWRFDAKQRGWVALPVKGTVPYQAYYAADTYWMVHDTKRDRLLLASGIDKRKGVVFAYDMKTGVITPLDPAGTEQMLKIAFMREAVYLPKQDAVLLLGRGSKLAPLYDCATNAWRAVQFEKVPKGLYGVSTGLMVDRSRDLIWATDTNSNVYVLRFDPATATFAE